MALTDLIANFDIFGKGINYTFNQNKTFRTKTGGFFSLVGLLIFLSINFWWIYQPLDPYSKIIKYRTRVKGDQVKNRKTLWPEDTFYFWAYVEDPNSKIKNFHFKQISEKELHKYIAYGGSYRTYKKENGKLVGKTYGVKFRDCTDDEYKFFNKSKTRFNKLRVKFDTGRPMVMTLGEEKTQKKFDYLNRRVLTFYYCNKTQVPECEDIGNKKITIVMKALNTLTDPNTVGVKLSKTWLQSFGLQAENKNLDSRSRTLNEKTNVFTLYRDKPKVGLFSMENIHYFDYHPLANHQKNFKPFEKGYEIHELGRFLNTGRSQKVHNKSLQIYIRNSPDELHVLFMKSMEPFSKKVAGLMSLMGLIILITYGSYNMRKMEIRIQEGILDRKDKEPLVKARKFNYFRFYRKNPGMALYVFFDRENKKPLLEKGSEGDEGLAKGLSTEDGNKKILLENALEDCYNEMTSIAEAGRRDDLSQIYREVLSKGLSKQENLAKGSQAEESGDSSDDETEQPNVRLDPKIKAITKKEFEALLQAAYLGETVKKMDRELDFDDRERDERLTLETELQQIDDSGDLEL